jgi:hypothetical protein
MKLFNLLNSLILCLICVACASPAAKPVTISKLMLTSDDARDFLNYADTYSNLPLEVQKQELTVTNQALLKSPNNLTQRMKLIMIYGLPSSALFDGPKAQNLLQQLLQDNMLSSQQSALGHLLFDYLIAINKANKNIKEDQKRIDASAQKNEALQIKLDTTQQKLDATQQKLNDLKDIEKSMSEREVTPHK